MYEQELVDEIVRTAEYDREKFWRLMKGHRKNNTGNSISVKNKTGVVVNEINDIVSVWEDHFSGLCAVSSDPSYDPTHYAYVTGKVKGWSNDRDNDQFLNKPFSECDLRNAVKRLNKGKSSGYDRVTSEHLQNAGESIYSLLTMFFNRLVQLEYVPRNFRTGTQIPLYKGKNTCSLDPNNYRGITILTSLNKVFEILIWGRVKGWWFDEHVISPLQGACRPGSSCVHSSLVLQESIAVGLDTKKVCNKDL